MADVLDVKFERPITVFSPRDVLDVIDRYCGWEIAKYLRGLFDELDSNSSAFQALLAEFADLEKELDQTRINRDKLRMRIDEIYAIVNNQI